jgi:hypothetical protein
VKAVSELQILDRIYGKMVFVVGEKTKDFLNVIQLFLRGLFLKDIFRILTL